VLPGAEVHPGRRRVRFLPGDLLGIVVAEYLRADAAAVPISANDAVERRMAERGCLSRRPRSDLRRYLCPRRVAAAPAHTHASLAGKLMADF